MNPRSCPARGCALPTARSRASGQRPASLSESDRTPSSDSAACRMRMHRARGRSAGSLGGSENNPRDPARRPSRNPSRNSQLCESLRELRFPDGRRSSARKENPPRPRRAAAAPRRPGRPRRRGRESRKPKLNLKTENGYEQRLPARRLSQAVSESGLRGSFCVIAMTVM